MYGVVDLPRGIGAGTASDAVFRGAAVRCHPERSEGPAVSGISTEYEKQILRVAQDDMVVRKKFDD